jgi:hypothetical protein
MCHWMSCRFPIPYRVPRRSDSVTALSYYVYYHVAPRSATAARDAIVQLLGRMSDDTGIKGKLLTKRQEPHLWMEVYEGVHDAGAFERALDANAAALRLGQYLAHGRRHVECFES